MAAPQYRGAGSVNKNATDIATYFRKDDFLVNPTPIDDRQAMSVVTSSEIQPFFTSDPDFMEILSALMELESDSSYAKSQHDDSEIHSLDMSLDEKSFDGEGMLMCPSATLTNMNASNPNDSSQYLREHQWRERYEMLIRFKEKHGHCRVQRKPEHKLLARWVKKQRYERRLKRSGCRSTLSDERESLLNDIGFIWDAHENMWDKRFIELSNYVRQFGNSRIPSTVEKYRQLANWTRGMRLEYRRYIRGESSKLTAERFARLTSIGFRGDP